MDNQDWNTPGTGNHVSGNHVYGQAGPSASPQPQLIPMGEGWASGVGGAPVATRSRRARWAMALGFVAVVAIVATAGAFVLSGAAGAGQSLTAAYAPKGTLSFTVLRTDLPGDQHQKLADFLSHFPGFGDRALFDTEIDNELNQLVSKISPDLTYTSGFKPWMQGEISIAAIDLGNLSSLGSSAALNMGMNGALNPNGMPMAVAAVQPPNAVMIVALKDKAAAQTFVSTETSKSSLKFTSSTYAGATLNTSTANGTSASYAFTDNVLLIGTTDGVKASLDAKSKGSLAADADFKAAMKSLSGDSISLFYVAEAALVRTELAAMPSGSSMMAQDDINFVLDNIPAWVAGQVRAESDHMLVDVTMPRSAGAAATGNHVSTLASQVPGSTVALVEIHSIGELVTSALDVYSGQSAPLQLRNQVNTIKTAIAGFGGLDWLGDGAAVLTKNGSTYDGGVVVQTTDAKAASDKLSLARTLIGAAGGYTSKDETYKGVTITTVRPSPNASDTGMTVISLPLVFASKDNLIIAGVTDTFVKSIIDTTEASSLASSDTYRTALAAAGTNNSGSGYVDIPTIAAGLADLSGNPGYFNANVKPYLDHVGGAAFAQIDGSTITIRFVVMAK